MKYKITEMPRVALGTWEITDPKQVNDVVKAALEGEYKHIDTAQIYFNEEMIGQALSSLDVPRENYWITTKITPFNYANHAFSSIKYSLERLQTTYVDTILLHAPLSDELNIRAYKAAMEARDKGMVRFIGVSNFTPEKIEAIYKATGEYPKYNQIIASVIQRAVEVEEYCNEKGITLMGYSSIRPYYNPNPFYADSGLTNSQKAKVDEVAKDHNVSPAIVLQSYIFSKGYVILPKSTKAERVTDNFKASKTKLTSEEVALFDSWNTLSQKGLDETIESWGKKNDAIKVIEGIGVRVGQESDQNFMKFMSGK